MIVVIGATGNVGRPLVDDLARAGAAVRAVARSEGSAAALRRAHPEAEVVRGDLADTFSLQQAMRGADSMFLLTPGAADLSDAQVRAIDAARRAGVGAVVKLSVLGAQAGSPLNFLDQHGRAEQHLAASGMAWTVLRPNGFMDNVLGWAGSIASDGVFVDSVADARVSVIAAADVAAVAAHVLTQSDRDEAVLELTGPAALSWNEMARIFTATLRRPVRYEAVDDATMLHRLRDGGVPEWQAEGLVELNAAYRAGAANVVTSTVAQVLGRPPINLTTWLQTRVELFTATSPQPGR